ncbi:uncharacterized protein LOC142769334 [Rhipicephalus microplus]|uniref:uncharacterized protein LOC142769334 n=1 Tax=Rhipicephalus microplus TaxID=6941 RepID=UPI003F6ADF82
MPILFIVIIINMKLVLESREHAAISQESSKQESCSWVQQLTRPPARGCQEQQQQARVALPAAAATTTAMNVPVMIGPCSTPGNANPARQPDVVVIRDLDHRGYEYIGQAPTNALKVFRGSSRTSSFSATFTFVLKMLVLILLKLNFAFTLLRFFYWLPWKSTNSFPEALFEISEVILSLAAITGAKSLWAYKSNKAMLSSRYFESSEANGGFELGQRSLRPPFSWHDKLVPPLLFGHAFMGLLLCFLSTFPSWTCEAHESLLDDPTRIFFLSLFTTSQAYMAMTTYTVFCLDVCRKMQCAAAELQCTYQFITHDALSGLHRKWERYCHYLSDISHNFLGFVCTWYCYLFVRCVYLITLLTAVLATGSCVAINQMYVPTFEASYLFLLCFVSIRLNRTLLSPVEHLRELTLSRKTSEAAIHIEVQRFMYRINKYLSMTLLKIPIWTDTALRAFGMLIVALLVLHGKLDHLTVL